MCFRIEENNIESNILIIIYNKSADSGTFIIPQKGDYTLIWENKNANKSIRISFFAYNERTQIIYPKYNIYLDPGERYFTNFTDEKDKSFLEWRWSVENLIDDKVNFWIEDDDGRKYNQITTFQNFSDEKGFWYFSRSEDCTLIWENANENGSITLKIKDFTTYSSAGIEPYTTIGFIILFLFLIIFYFIYKRKYLIKVEIEKPSKKYKIIGLLIILLVFLWFILPPLFYLTPAEEEHLTIEPNSTVKKSYNEMFKDDQLTWHWKLENNTNIEINFWIEDKDGTRYKYSTSSDNITSNMIFFIASKEGSYWAIWENPSNETVNIHYKFKPDTDAVEQIYLGSYGFILIFSIVLIGIDVYMVIKNRRIKRNSHFKKH